MKRLSELIQTTSGVGGKSSAITEERISNKQIPVLEGQSIYKYVVQKKFFFDFEKNNITGRTTDQKKLGYIPKILLRKTGNSIIAAFDVSGIFPEQSLYFIYGQSAIDLFYLLGLLNSRLTNFIYFHSALTNRNSIAQAKKVDLDDLPIIQPDDLSLVQRISRNALQLTRCIALYYAESLEHRRSLLRRRIAALEANTDAAVYELYGLTQEERDAREPQPHRAMSRQQRSRPHYNPELRI